LGLANPTEKVLDLKKDKERCYRLVLRYFVFLDRELERKAEMTLSEENNDEWQRRKAVLMGKRFNGVPLCNIKSNFVTIDSGVLHDIMKEICPEFNGRKTEFTGETRETYWKNIFDFKLRKVSKQRVFTGIIETDGVSMCVHCRRLEADRPIVPSASPLTKHEEKKEADPTTQEVHESDFVVGVDPGNTMNIAVAAPKRAEDGSDGDLRQKDMRLFKLSRARYHRESGIMNARKKIETWNAGIKDHLEVMGEVASRGADFKAFREFVKIRVAHWDALWEEYTKPRWARLRMNLYCGKQRAFANFFNQLRALKEDESQRLVVAYGAGRRKTHKGTTPAPRTRAYKECAPRFDTIPVDEFRTSYTHHELGVYASESWDGKAPAELRGYGKSTEP